MGIRKEIEANEYKNNTDGQLLLAASSLWKSKHDGVLKDSGDSTIGGVPAKFFVHIDNMRGKSPQRILSYVFVKNKAIYSFMIFCADAEFDSNYDMFIKMKDTFQFRRKY